MVGSFFLLLFMAQIIIQRNTAFVIIEKNIFQYPHLLSSCIEYTDKAN